MRIVQLIDSLEAGGAERMAVNLANGLAKQVEFSGLISTRKEGLFKHTLPHILQHYYFVCCFPSSNLFTIITWD